MGLRSLSIAFKAFARPVCEYGNVVFMGAASTHLYKLDGIQQLAERSSESTFPTLCSRRSASAMGLLCKMLVSCCRDPLHRLEYITLLNLPIILSSNSFLFYPLF